MQQYVCAVAQVHIVLVQNVNVCVFHGCIWPICTTEQDLLNIWKTVKYDNSSEVIVGNQLV